MSTDDVVTSAGSSDVPPLVVMFAVPVLAAAAVCAVMFGIAVWLDFREERRRCGTCAGCVRRRELDEQREEREREDRVRRGECQAPAAVPDEGRRRREDARA